MRSDIRQQRQQMFLAELAEAFQHGNMLLLDVIHAIKREYRYLPSQILKEFCRLSHLPPSQLQGFISSHANLSTHPPPRVDVKVCVDLPCHLAGSRRLFQAVAGSLDANDQASVCGGERHCAGFCGSAPVASVNGWVHSNLTPARLRELVAAELKRSQSKPSTPRTSQKLREPSLAQYVASGGYAAFERLIRNGDPNSVIQQLDAVGLRGMGGAGVKASLKWRMVRNADGREKIVICNAEEGEPGTFKDRTLLTENPHSMLEGLLIAAWTVGASKTYVYLREEYAEARLILARCIKQLESRGLIGTNIRGSGFSFSVRLVVGAGSYVSGEETALLESMEGRRCEPRLRPPYPATHGLWGKPTLIQNAETLSYVGRILQESSSEFEGSSQRATGGMKLYSVSGRVRRPGVYKLPLGVSAQKLIYDNAGGPPDGEGLKAFFPGGVSSGFLPHSLVDVALDFDELNKLGCSLGTAGVIVVSNQSCIVDVVENCLTFFARESCGKCTPCRIGTEKQLAILRAVRVGKAQHEDIALLKELGAVMQDASICGLGQTAYTPVQSALEFFEDEFLEHLHGRCPAGVCTQTVG